MKLKFALAGLAALSGVALSIGSASAMPIGLAVNSVNASNIDTVRLVCDAYGRCFRTAPRYGYYGGPVVRFGYGGGYRRGGWHHGRRW